MTLSVTLILVLLTVGTSIWAWQDANIMSKWIFNPYRAHHNNQYYRFLSSGFIHKDYLHLLFNMFVLYMFGNYVEDIFTSHFSPAIGSLLFLALYIMGIIVADIPTYFKHKDAAYYNALGASGGVSSILFSFILFYPLEKLCLYGIRFLCFPGILWGVVYLGYTVFMSKRRLDNVNHDAHLYGALFGIIFTLIFIPESFSVFIQQMANFTLF